MNHAYATAYVGGRQIRVKSKEMRLWERQFMAWAMQHTLAIRYGKEWLEKNPGKLLDIQCDFYFQRRSIFTLDGKPKRNDTSNRLKALHDQVATALAIDDSLFFDGRFRKRMLKNGSSDFVNVTIGEISE